MTLAEIRNLFIERSGRYDLVTETEVPVEGGEEGETEVVITDNGADFFINAGVRLLDKLIEHMKTESSHFGSLAIGAYSFQFPECRTITEVWLSNTEARWPLRLANKAEFYAAYAGPVSKLSQGLSGVYLPVNLRIQDGIGYQSMAEFLQSFSTYDSNLYNGVLFHPLDRPCVIEVVGKFNSLPLTMNTDENYWTLVFPDLLLIASFYKLETFNRNKEGAADWLAALQGEMQLLEFDFVDQISLQEDLR